LSNADKGAVGLIPALELASLTDITSLKTLTGSSSEEREDIKC